MTKPNDVGASTSYQEHISAAVLPIFCNAMDVLASPCARLICPTNHMLHHTKKGKGIFCEKGILYYSYVKNLDEDPQYFQLVASTLL